MKINKISRKLQAQFRRIADYRAVNILLLLVIALSVMRPTFKLNREKISEDYICTKKAVVPNPDYEVAREKWVATCISTYPKKSTYFPNLEAKLNCESRLVTINFDQPKTIVQEVPNTCSRIVGTENILTLMLFSTNPLRINTLRYTTKPVK